MNETILDTFLHHGRPSISAGFYSTKTFLGADGTSQLEVLCSFCFLGRLSFRILLDVRRTRTVTHTHIFNHFSCPADGGNTQITPRRSHQQLLKSISIQKRLKSRKSTGRTRRSSESSRVSWVQGIDTAIIYYGAYAYLWQVAGNLIARFGYGTEYEVSHCAGRPKFSSDRLYHRSSSQMCIAPSFWCCPPFLPFLSLYTARSSSRRDTASIRLLRWFS